MEDVSVSSDSTRGDQYPGKGLYCFLPSTTAFNHPSSAVGQITYSNGLSLCLKERRMELELTGVRVKDSKVNLTFLGFLPFVPPLLPHSPHGKVSALWQQCGAALL